MKRIVVTLALICVCHASFADTSGDWTYTVSNNQATITGYNGAGGAVTIPSEVNGVPVIGLLGGYDGDGDALGVFPQSVIVTSLIIPSSVTSIGDRALAQCRSLTNVTIPNSVVNIGASAFKECTALSNITIPQSVATVGELAFKYTGLTSITFPMSLQWVGYGALSGCAALKLVVLENPTIDRQMIFVCNRPWDDEVPNPIIVDRVFLDYLSADSGFISALASNDAFVTAVANKIKATGGNYGIATQSGLSTAIEPLATKTQITTAINEGKASGIASVTASPNTWSLFTSSQIQNMAIGDLVLTREVNGNFVLNYDIEQSNDLANWTVYSANTQIVKLPADKAFVRIKAKQ